MWLKEINPEVLNSRPIKPEGNFVANRTADHVFEVVNN